MSGENEAHEGLAVNQAPDGVIEAAERERRNMRTCVVCEKLFTPLGRLAPHLLSCGHNICRLCAEREYEASSLPRLIACPVCTQRSVAPLRPNLILSAELEHLRALDEYKPPAKKKPAICVNHPSRQVTIGVDHRECAYTTLA